MGVFILARSNSNRRWRIGRSDCNEDNQGGFGMIQIPLKRKYKTGFKGRFRGGERPAPKKKHTKIGYAKHVALYGEPPRVTLRVNGKTGKGVFVKM